MATKISAARRLFTSSVGRKLLMGITGLGMILFLIGHMLGNLLYVVGPAEYNAYGHALTSNPAIYVVEAGLILFFLVHIVNGVRTTMRGRAARSARYKTVQSKGHTSRRSFSSQTMIFTGVVLGIFVPLHLWTFKFGPNYTGSGESQGMRDLAKLVGEVFESPVYVAMYVLAMAVVGFHMWHGFGSAFESLGTRHRGGLRRLGNAIAAIVAVGFLVVPLYVIAT